MTPGTVCVSLTETETFWVLRSTISDWERPWFVMGEDHRICRAIGEAAQFSTRESALKWLESRRPTIGECIPCEVQALLTYNIQERP